MYRFARIGERFIAGGCRGRFNIGRIRSISCTTANMISSDTLQPRITKSKGTNKIPFMERSKIFSYTLSGLGNDYPNLVAGRKIFFRKETTDKLPLSVHFRIPLSFLVCSGHLRHDYLIKYAYFVKCYLNRFASISDPEK